MAVGDSIKVFTKEGVYVRVYGDPNYPVEIAINEDGYSIVGDTGGHCLSIFDPLGNKIHKVVNLRSDWQHHWGLALHPRMCSVYVSNLVGGCIEVFSC